jgi:hypothetical protein
VWVIYDFWMLREGLGVMYTSWRHGVAASLEAAGFVRSSHVLMCVFQIVHSLVRVF